MYKIKSIYFSVIALFAISSLQAVTSFKLSQNLQQTYIALNKETGLIVFPYIAYKIGDVTNKIYFFSDKEWFDTSVEIPSDILEFDIYLPTTMFGKYIRFTFSPARCHFPAPDFSHLDQEILSAVLHPQPQSFISEGNYSIDMRYIFNSEGPICAQCMLIRENQERSNILVSISNMP